MCSANCTYFPVGLHHDVFDDCAVGCDEDVVSRAVERRVQVSL